jgi:hypothetical protein
MANKIVDGIQSVISGGQSRTQQQTPQQQPTPAQSVGAPTIPANLLSNDVRQRQEEEQKRQRDNVSALQNGTGVYQPATPTQNREGESGGNNSRSFELSGGLGGPGGGPMGGSAGVGVVGDFTGGENRTVDEGNKRPTLNEILSKGSKGPTGGRRYTVTVNLQGETASAILLVNQTQKFNLKSGYNTYEVNEGDVVSVSSADITKHTLTSLVLVDDSGVQEERRPDGRTVVGKNAPKDNVVDSARELEARAVKQSVPPPISPQMEKRMEDISLPAPTRSSAEFADVISPTRPTPSRGVDSTPPPSTVATYTVTKNIGLVATTSAVAKDDVLKPIINLSDEKDMVYDLAKDNTDYRIIFLHKNDPTSIVVNINGRDYEYRVSDTPVEMLRGGYAQVFISKDIFKVLGIGKLNLLVTPKKTTSRGVIEGEPINTIIKVTNSTTENRDDKVVEETTELPDIRNIRYPKLIKAADYGGLDVKFEISWSSANTDYIRIFKGDSEKAITEGPEGKLRLNFKDLVAIDSKLDSEDDNVVSINLTLIPYKKLKEKELEGKAEIITISLEKSTLSIPRTTAINRLADAFACQLDVNLFTDDTSKYLTHLLHINPTFVIANWVGNNGSLILKLYEPLPTSIQPNQLVWISKMQSTPIVNTISITGESMMKCPVLKGPNFSLEPDNGIGYKYFDELIASGSITSADLTARYLEKVGISEEDLNIQYASGSNYTFENFVHFSSAQERISNFYYKIQLLESYVSEFNSFSISVNDVNILLTEDGFQLITEAGETLTAPYVYTYAPDYLVPYTLGIVEKIQAIQRGFDGFEKWLYKSSHILAYPKTTAYYPSNPVTNLPVYSLKPTTDTTVQSWYEAALFYAQEYDKLNPNYLNNNIPEFIRTDIENDDFIIFMDMIGQHFDMLRTYIIGLNRIRKQSESPELGIPNELVWHLLKSMGWDGIRAYDSQFLWEYAFGLNQDGSQKYGMSLEDANNQLWRRILNNLPYILKNKGTSRAFKAVMACYGVPNSMLTIMEFGGPKDPSSTRATTQFTFDDITAAIQMKASASIDVPWKSGSYVDGWGNSYPQALEFRFKPDLVKTSRIISASQFSIDIVQTTGSFARLDLVFGEGSAGGYFDSEYVTASITYALGPTEYTASLDFPLSTEHYSTILVNKHQYAGFDGMYEVLLRTTDGERITTAVSMSFRTDTRFWDSGSSILIGNDFSGALDEVRLWTEPLSMSKFENHALFPDAINGNRFDSSTEDLLLRLDFEYPKDRILDPSILNVAISDVYLTSYVSASNFYSASDYPYQYVPYERTVTANVPATGLSYSNKVRLEEIFDKNGNSVSGGLVLSHRVRNTQKAFDRAPIDSNRIGIFFSPNKELNMDILKAFGDFNIDNYLGDYSDEYKDEYSELGNLRNYYFQRLNRNINEYINLVRYVNKSLFEVLQSLSPARAKVSKGLLIEPHYLERSKTKWDKPVSLRNDFEGEYDLESTITVESSNIMFGMNLTSSVDNQIYTLTSDYSVQLAEINESGSSVLTSELLSYESLVDYNTDNLLEVSVPSYDMIVGTNTSGSTLIGEADAFSSEQIGMNPNSLANKGFGLYAENGTGIYKYYDIFGNYTQSRQSMFVVKEQYQKKISTQTGGWPTNGAQPGDSVVYEDVVNTFYRLNVSLLPFSGSITLGNNVVEVTSINGYLPTHYKFVNNLSQGLRDSFFNGSKQTEATTPDGLPPVETFTTNPNILRVASAGRGSGEPILQVD